MFFTQEDYRSIEQWLKLNAKMDTDFPVLTDITPNEDILTIVSKRSNYLIKISDLLNSVLSKLVIDFIVAKAIKVNDTLTVDASKLIIDSNSEYTLQDLIDEHNDTDSAARGWKIEYQNPEESEPTVKAKYVLKDYKGVQKGNTIKIYKDSAITNVYLGTITDTCDPITGLPTKYPIQDNNDALCIVYHLEDGTYNLVPIPIGIFTKEAEFDKYRGLGITSNGQVFIKLANDRESANYLHFTNDGELSADGIEDRILLDLGSLITSVAGDGTMWGQYKQEEGTKETSQSSDGSRWGEFRKAEEERNKVIGDIDTALNMILFGTT